LIVTFFVTAVKMFFRCRRRKHPRVHHARRPPRAIPPEFRFLPSSFCAGWQANWVPCRSPWQGIAAHKDHRAHFGSPVVSASLGSGVVGQFGRPREQKHCDVWLPRRGLRVLEADASGVHWTHAIAARRSDVVDGREVARD